MKDPKLGRLLKVLVSDQQVLLPVVKQCPYLGAVLSYGQFEAQTLKERVKQSWSAFNRLLPALRSSGVSLKHRVLTWRTCVHSVLVHGLDSIGLAPGGATKLHKHVLRQLRILSKAPSFITREPARALLARLQVEEPLQQLLHRTQQRIRTCQQTSMHQLQPDMVHQWWKQIEQGLQVASSDPMLQQHCTPLRAPVRLVALTAKVTPQACPHCGIYYPSVRALRIHVALKHPETQAVNPTPQRSYAQMRADYIGHSIDGMPACVHCRWEFTSWASFCLHFEKKRCPVFHHGTFVAPKPPVSPVRVDTSKVPEDLPTATSEPHNSDLALQARQATPSLQSESLATPPPKSCPMSEHNNLEQACRTLPKVPRNFCQLALQNLWRQLAEQIQKSDMHFCLLCGQWLAHPGYFSRHLRALHPEAYRLHSAVLQWLQDRTPAVQSPCCFCGDNYKARHCSRPRHAKECPTLYRTGLLIKLLGKPTPIRTIQQALQHGAQPRRHPGGSERGGLSGVDVCGGAGEPVVLDDGQKPGHTAPHDGDCTPIRGQHPGPHASAGASGSDSGPAGSHGHPRDQTPGGALGGSTAGVTTRQRKGRRQVASLPEQGQCSVLGRWLGSRPPSTGTAPTPLTPVGLGQGQGGQNLRPGDGSQALRAVPGNEPVDHEARGPDVHQPCPGQLRDVRSDPRSPIGDPGALQGHRSLEANEEGAAGSDHPSTAHVAAEALGGPHVAQADANAHSAAPCCAPLPHHEGIGAEHAVGCGSADAPDRESHGGVPPAVERLLPSQPQRGVQGCGHVPSGRPNGPLSTGASHSEDDRRHVRTLRLLNTSNFCYSNAAALAFCWLHRTGLPSSLASSSQWMAAPH